MMASDYVTDVLLSDVLRGLETSAPNMRVDILPMHDAPQEAIERQQIDLLVSLDYALSPDHPSKILFEDDHVVIGWDQNPAMHEEITWQHYFELGHVVARFGKARVPAFEDVFMRRMKQTRRVEVVAPSFLSLGGLVIGTNRIATVHRRMAVKMASYAPITLRELPFIVPPIRETVQWHIANSNDASLRWFIEQTVAAAGTRATAAGDKVVPLDGSKGRQQDGRQPEEGHEIDFHPVPHNG
jgi:LysR family nod box-dependent transcriptional activator